MHLFRSQHHIKLNQQLLRWGTALGIHFSCEVAGTLWVRPGERVVVLALTLEEQEPDRMPKQSGMTAFADVPSLYIIVVDGRLDPDWSDRLSGMQISPSGDAISPQTRLTGWLRDQCALHGVLSVLSGLSVPIASLERIRTASEPAES